MTERALYSTLARYYDRVYHQKDYDDDARRLDAIIEGRKRSPGSRLLDIGCGTGEHILRFSDRYECTGIDLREEMMEVARRKVPRARFQQMDMRYLELGTTFDVIISMFGTIGYATTLEDLQRVADGIGAHLAIGGLAVVEPFLSAKDFKPGHVAMVNYEDDDVKISRVSMARLDGDLCTLEMHYLVGERGKGVGYVLDTHTVRLHEPEELVASLEGAGLRAEFDPVGFADRRGAVIVTRDG